MNDYQKGRADIILEIKTKVSDIDEKETGEYFLAKVLMILKALKWNQSSVTITRENKTRVNEKHTNRVYNIAANMPDVQL